MLMKNNLKTEITFQFIMKLLTVVSLSINNITQYQSNPALKNEINKINFSQDNK